MSQVLLDELGFNSHFFNQLRASYLSPLATALFPEWVGSTLDSHRAFTVKYDRSCGDVDLSCHYDDAEVSVNISLGGDYEGGSLFFGGMLGVWCFLTLSFKFQFMIVLKRRDFEKNLRLAKIWKCFECILSNFLSL